MTERELVARYGKERVDAAKEKFKSYTIQHDIVFYHVMKNKAFCEKLLRLILKKELHIKESDPQATISAHPESKTVRLDVLATDDQGNHYDIEMQMTGGDSIPKRMRMYQQAIDSSFFDKGMKYTDATDTIIIFICKNDPIGFGLPQYTFQNLCLENPNIKLSDGTLKIIDVSSQWNKAEDKDLKNFLKYVDKGEVSDEFTEDLDMYVTGLKYDEDRSVDCCSWVLRLEEEKEIGRQEGVQQGIQQGIQQGALATARNMKREGFDALLISRMTGLRSEDIDKL